MAACLLHGPAPGFHHVPYIGLCFPIESRSGLCLHSYLQLAHRGPVCLRPNNEELNVATPNLWKESVGAKHGKRKFVQAVR